MHDSQALRFGECLRTGDLQALATIWDSFGPDLRRRARTRLRQFGLLGHTEAMDICNAVLLELIRQSDFPINSPEDLMKYIRRAIDNQVRDEFRLLTRQRRDVRRREGLPVENFQLSLQNSSPSQVMIRNEIFDRIIRFLGHGGEQLLNMVLQEFSWQEIGRELNANPDALRMRWQRAVKTIQLQMIAEWEPSRG